MQREIGGFHIASPQAKYRSYAYLPLPQTEVVCVKGLTGSPERQVGAALVVLTALPMVAQVEGPNTYEAPGCQETNYPPERIFAFFRGIGPGVIGL